MDPAWFRHRANAEFELRGGAVNARSRAKRGRSVAESVDGDEHSSTLKDAMAGHSTGLWPTPAEAIRSCIAIDPICFP